MAYKFEKDTGDLVFSGWEKGIASSPHLGLGDLKCLNVSSIPGEVSVNYARVQQTQVVISSATFSASGIDNVVVYTGSTPLLVGTWVTIASGSSITNLDTSHGFASGASYYVKSYDTGTGDTTLSIAWQGSIISNFGLTGTATFSTVNIGKPTAYAYTNNSGPVSFPNYNYFVLDSNALVWLQSTGSTNWELLQPTAPNSGTGIFCFGSYLMLVGASGEDIFYKSLGSLGTAWTDWTAIGPLEGGAGNNQRPSVITPSGLLVLCDGSQLDSLAQNPSETFNPTSAVTYTWQSPAVQLPTSDVANTIALIGNGSAATGGTGGATNVLVGGLSNIIYPWAPGTSFFQPVIFVSEAYIQQMVTVNNLVYIFAGSKGNVYITNGSSLTSVISVPDYIANSTGGNQDPYFVWGGAMYLRGRVWFSVQAPNCGGIWSFIPTINYFPQQDSGISLRLEHQNSYGTYNGMASILFPPQKSTDQEVEGVQYFSGWTNGSGVNGIDFSGTTPYANSAAIIETDIVPFGQLLGMQKGTPTNIEFKLSAPLVSGESVIINYRSNLSTSFASAGTIQYENTSDIGQVVGYISPHLIQNVYWLQFQIVLTSTATSPSFVRFQELRVRTK